MQLTVVSGKGGTGKTTLAVAISELENALKVDCDVDAPNLYLYYQGENVAVEDFFGGKKAIVDELLCSECGKCQEVCQFEAIEKGKILFYRCEGCGACTLTCPRQAIKLADERTARIHVTKPTTGRLTYAQMEIGSEGSGKLITALRKKAQHDQGDKMIVNDGSPGIGCPVISSITAADAVLIVSEPTQSGVEDLDRVVQLCKQFAIQTFVCVNKADINEEISRHIEEYCQTKELRFAGRIPYDETVLQSINALQPIIHYQDSPANQAIRQIWKNIRGELFNKTLINGR